MCVAACIAMVFGVVTWRATAIAIGSAILPGAQTEQSRKAPVLRADIVDRHGDLLATSVAIDSLALDPSQVWDPEDTAQQLCGNFSRIRF